MSIVKRSAAEFIGTFWLVLGGCGSTGPALLEGGIALQQLWLFWLAPIVGAVLAGVIVKWFDKD